MRVNRTERIRNLAYQGWTTFWLLLVLSMTTAGVQAQSPQAAHRAGEQSQPFDGGFGYPVYPLSDARLCPSGATHTYSYTREFSIAGDMVFTCMVDPSNPNISQIVVYDRDFRLAFRDAAGAARLGGVNLREPQFSQMRRVMFARDNLRIYELDPWSRKNHVYADFGRIQFELNGQKVPAYVGRDFKVGPGDAILIELGTPRRVLHPATRDCPDCFEVLGVATFDPATGKIHTERTRGDGRVAAWPKVGTSGFDEGNLTQDSPPRVFLTYQNRPSWGLALDFSDPVEFRHPSFPPFGDRKYQWSAHGHMGFFCGSNGRCYVVKPLNDIIDDDLDGVPDRVGAVGTMVNSRWRELFHLSNTRTGKVELVWGADNPEKRFSGAHFSRSLAPNVFFGSGAKHESNTITRYTVRYDATGNPVEVLGENLAYTNSDIRCGYWAHPRVTSSDDGLRALFDSTLAGQCKTHVYVVDSGPRCVSEMEARDTAAKSVGHPVLICKPWNPTER